MSSNIALSVVTINSHVNASTVVGKAGLLAVHGSINREAIVSVRVETVVNEPVVVVTRGALSGLILNVSFAVGDVTCNTLGLVYIQVVVGVTSITLSNCAGSLAISSTILNASKLAVIIGSHPEIVITLLTLASLIVLCNFTIGIVTS